MINKVNKNIVRKNRSKKIRDKVTGTANRPRLSVHRTLVHIYAQLIDDEKGVTITSASTVNKAIQSKLNGKTKQEQAFMIGEIIAKNAKAKGIKTIVFDRAGYLYTGRVKALADGARKAGLEF